MGNNRREMVNKYGFSARSRSQEFGLGATFKDEHPDGTKVQRSAIEAVGGTRDNAQAKMLPKLDNPPTWDADRQELWEQRHDEWYS